MKPLNNASRWQLLLSKHKPLDFTRSAKIRLANSLPENKDGYVKRRCSIYPEINTLKDMERENWSHMPLLLIIWHNVVVGLTTLDNLVATSDSMAIWCGRHVEC